MQLEASLASRSGSTAFRSSSPRLAQAQQQHAHRRERRRAPLTVRAATAPTAYSWESQRLIKVLATRQAIKTLLRYLGETNGEQHLWLHNYVADTPIPLSGDTDPDEWLARLATTPLTKVQDPRRSSVPSVAAAAAVLHGEREVSPRDVAERIMELRQHIAAEMAEGLAKMGESNAAVRRRALELSVVEFKPPEL